MSEATAATIGRRGTPRRRDVLAGGAALALLPHRLLGGEAPPFTAHVDVDVHCHTFCSADLPIVGFVARYIPGLSDVTRELTRWPEVVVRTIVGVVAKVPNAATPTGPAELASLRAALAVPGTLTAVPQLPPRALEDLVDELTRLVPFSINGERRQMIARYLDTLYLAAHARAAIAASVAETYPSVTLFTPCLVDYDAWSDDRAPTPLATQILIQEVISRLSIQGKVQRADARFHPFVAFDPRRDAEAKTTAPPAAAAPDSHDKPIAAPTPTSGALEMVRYAIESAGFLGVKIYPAVGFAPIDNVRWRRRQPLSARIDAALRALYAYCQAEEVPITAHTSAGNEFGIGFRDLVAPDRWAPVLESAPNLRLNFGHFGHDYGVDRDKGVNASEAWIRQASALIQAYPNVYADLSNSPLVYDTTYAVRFLRHLRELTDRYPKVKRRLMYGSDWWLNRLEPGSQDFPEAVRRALATQFSADEVADIMGRNALRFLGFLDENNRLRSGRSARRLRKFYGAAPTPIWLA